MHTLAHAHSNMHAMHKAHAVHVFAWPDVPSRALGEAEKVARKEEKGRWRSPKRR